MSDVTDDEVCDLAGRLEAFNEGHQNVAFALIDEAAAMIRRLSAQTVGWRGIENLSAVPGHYDIRTVTTYRWLPYKAPPGKRHGGRKGRWQSATEYGWKNDSLPYGGDWKAHPPLPPTHPRTEDDLS